MPGRKPPCFFGRGPDEGPRHGFEDASVAKLDARGDPAPRVGHRLFDHTADVGIEADGPGPGEALAEAGVALTELMTGRSAHSFRPDSEMAFTVEAPDEPALVVAFLSELLWHLESQDHLWLGGGVTVAPTKDGVQAVARGNALKHNPQRHGRGVEVKAVTYHEIAAGWVDGRWRLRVILDL